MEVTKEDITQFKNYIKNHVDIVNLLGKLAFSKDYSEHDLDKQKADGDVLNTYALRNAVMNKKGWPSKDEKKAMNKLAGHHVKINSHHPEYWDDSISEDEFDERKPPVCHAENMSKEALEEMCCDWAAVALKKNVPVSDWYNNTVDKRFFFTDSQKKFIKKYLAKMEKIIEDNDIRFPGFGKYSANTVSFKEKTEPGKSVALTFGRMNPPTVGHMKVCEKLHSISADSKFIYLSHSQDKPNKKNPLKCKNPLPYEIKFLYVNTFIKESSYSDVNLQKSDAKNILDALFELNKLGYTDAIIIVGSDRISEFEALVNKYNNVINPKTNEVYYNFNSINVISAGDRDEGSNDEIEAMSASKMRQLAVENNFEEFKKGVPSSDINLIRELYDDVRNYMGLN